MVVKKSGTMVASILSSKTVPARSIDQIHCVTSQLRLSKRKIFLTEQREFSVIKKKNSLPLVSCISYVLSKMTVSKNCTRFCLCSVRICVRFLILVIMLLTCCVLLEAEKRKLFASLPRSSNIFKESSG